jgi:hypothetical protein
MLKFEGHVIVLGLWCNGKNALELFTDHDERFNFVIQNFFAKNKYCDTVKIFKKNPTNVILFQSLSITL